MATATVTDHWPGPHRYRHDWALVDVETTGLRPDQDRVLSLAVVTMDPDGRRTGEYSTLLDPGCDPGPVHVHGLTRERLRGAPVFDDVAERVADLLRGRVLVAHNAQFDYDFLAHEFARARSWIPVSERLCTLALNRQVAPPVPNMRLGTLAAHYGVVQRHAHDALDDTRVLAGIFGHTLHAAWELGLPLPLVACPTRLDHRPRIPKTPCPYRNPGRYSPGGPLVQGMKVAVSGDTARSREELVARAVAAGLNVMETVSRHTSVLVTNVRPPGTGAGPVAAKLRRALAEGVPLLDEESFLRLLDRTEPGVPHDAAATPAEEPEGADDGEESRGAAVLRAPGAGPVGGAPVPAPRGGEEDPPGAGPGRSGERERRAGTAPRAGTAQRAGTAPQAGRTPQAGRGPLAGRRVLVVGGGHEQAAAARARLVGLGASAAVRLSAQVTDVLALPGGERDEVLSRVAALRLPVHGPGWPHADAPESAPEPGAGAADTAAGADSTPDTGSVPEADSTSDAGGVPGPVDVLAAGAAPVADRGGERVPGAAESAAAREPAGARQVPGAPATPGGPDLPAAPELPAAPQLPVVPVLRCGDGIGLPAASGADRWTVCVSWAPSAAPPVDVVAFVLGEGDRLRHDGDLVRPGAAQRSDGAVRLTADGPADQAVTVDLAALGAAARRVVIGAVVGGGAAFGEVGGVEVTVARGVGGTPAAQATLDAAAGERTLLLAEFRRRTGPGWWFGAVGRGLAEGLGALARGYGAEVDGLPD